MPDTVFFQFTNGVIVIIAPDQIGVAGRITPFVTDHRQPEGGGYFCNRAVQGRGEGMGGIDQQPDVFSRQHVSIAAVSMPPVRRIPCAHSISWSAPLVE